MKGNSIPYQNTGTHDRVVSYKAVAVNRGIGCDSDLILGNTGMVILFLEEINIC